MYLTPLNLQIPNIEQLKNNSGFLDNFIWPLVVGVILVILGLLIDFFKSKMSNKNEKKSIIVTSFRQSGGITAGVVNVTNSNQYIQPNSNIVSQVDNNLKFLLNEFPVRPVIIIEVENGNSQRHQIANDLGKIIQKFNLGSYPKGNTYMGRFPDSPITVVGNKNNIQFFQQFVNAIHPYLSSKWYYEQIDSFPDDFLKIYINGIPTFNENGSINIS